MVHLITDLQIVLKFSATERSAMILYVSDTLDLALGKIIATMTPYQYHDCTYTNDKFTDIHMPLD